MELLLTFLFVALFFSFLCSLLESVLLSVTPSYIALLKQKEYGYANQLDRFKKKIDRPLAAILTLNTFAHTLGAAGVGAQAQILWGETYLSIVSAVLTLLILIFSEIIPKTIGANYWKSFTRTTTYALMILIYSPLYPFILLSELITKLFPKPKNSVHEMREEVSAMVDYGKEHGAFRDSEIKIVQNLMRFQFIKARDIMTPRIVMQIADANMSVRDFYSGYKILPHSRIPVYSGDKSHINAYVLKTDILDKILDNQSDIKLKDIQRPMNIVVESTPVFKLYESMIEKNEHISLVLDEYGVVAGLVSMEDIVESILGLEIVDETDNVEDMQEHAMELLRKRYEKRSV